MLLLLPSTAVSGGLEKKKELVMTALCNGILTIQSSCNAFNLMLVYMCRYICMLVCVCVYIYLNCYVQFYIICNYS